MFKEIRKSKISLIFLTLMGIGIYFLAQKLINFHIDCPFHSLTGLYCPGCGTTRMIKSLFQGQFYQAFRYNPLVFLMLPLFIFIFLDWLFTKQNHQRQIEKLEPFLWYILIIIFLSYGVMRNLKIFSFLIPTIL